MNLLFRTGICDIPWTIFRKYRKL